MEKGIEGGEGVVWCGVVLYGGKVRGVKISATWKEVRRELSGNMKRGAEE